MLAGMSEVNALLMWRRFKPGQEGCEASLFRRRLTFQLLHHFIRLAEREEGLALSRSRRLGIPGAPEHYLVQNPIGYKNKMRRLHCMYCDKKSAYSCACAPWTGGDMKARDAMVVCSDRHGGRCMLRHRAREKPPHKRVRSKRHSWTSKPKASPKNGEPDSAEGSRKRSRRG